MLAIISDVKLLAQLPIYFELNIVLKAVFGVKLNLQMFSLLALKLQIVVDPVSDLEQKYPII
jgi:hypothetical protein